MEQLEEFLGLVNERKEKRRSEMIKAEKLQINEMDNFRNESKNIVDEYKKSREAIDKSLNTIISYKNNIYKTQCLNNENSLPISNAHHENVINFISNVVSFINDVGDNKLDLKRTIDEVLLTKSVQDCCEDFMKQIGKERNIISGTNSIISEMPNMKNYTDSFESDSFHSNTSIFEDE